jgi:hypothetical protein
MPVDEVELGQRAVDGTAILDHANVYDLVNMSPAYGPNNLVIFAYDSLLSDPAKR